MADALTFRVTSFKKQKGEATLLHKNHLQKKLVISCLLKHKKNRYR
jgi:hypothetical protein